MSAQARALLETMFVICAIILPKQNNQALERPREAQRLQCTASVPGLRVLNEGRTESRVAETIQLTGLTAFVLTGAISKLPGKFCLFPCSFQMVTWGALL